MITSKKTDAFSALGDCISLGDVVKLIASNRSNPTIRKMAGAYGMLLQGSHSIRSTRSFDDSRYVVDQLARAKAEIDIAAWHSPDVAEVTAKILAGVQAFLDQETIGSTEWPAPDELATIAANMASECDARLSGAAAMFKNLPSARD